MNSVTDIFQNFWSIRAFDAAFWQIFSKMLLTFSDIFSVSCLGDILVRFNPAVVTVTCSPKIKGIQIIQKKTKNGNLKIGENSPERNFSWSYSAEGNLTWEIINRSNSPGGFPRNLFSTLIKNLLFQPIKLQIFCAFYDNQFYSTYSHFLVWYLVSNRFFILRHLHIYCFVLSDTLFFVDLSEMVLRSIVNNYDFQEPILLPICMFDDRKDEFREI